MERKSYLSLGLMARLRRSFQEERQLLLWTAYKDVRRAHAIQRARARRPFLSHGLGSTPIEPNKSTLIISGLHQALLLTTTEDKKPSRSSLGISFY